MDSVSFNARPATADYAVERSRVQEPSAAGFVDPREAGGLQFVRSPLLRFDGQAATLGHGLQSYGSATSSFASPAALAAATSTTPGTDSVATSSVQTYPFRYADSAVFPPAGEHNGWAITHGQPLNRVPVSTVSTPQTWASLGTDSSYPYSSSASAIPRSVVPPLFGSIYGQQPQEITPGPLYSTSAQLGYPSVSAAPMTAPAPHNQPGALQPGDLIQWPILEQHATVMREDGRVVEVDIVVEPCTSFFRGPDEGYWTVYRRNYFSATASYCLEPCDVHARHYVRRGDGSRVEVQSFGMRLAGRVDHDETGEGIELVMFTPKRDNGPRFSPPTVPLAPRMPTPAMAQRRASQMNQIPAHYHAHAPFPDSLLPLRVNTVGGEQSGQGRPTALTGKPVTHAFERVQFKHATLNNGKRRASQQYFIIAVELFADVRHPSSKEPEWLPVVTRTSEIVVCRGRSPSHYSGDKDANRAARGGRTGGGGARRSAARSPSYATSMATGQYSARQSHRRQQSPSTMLAEAVAEVISGSSSSPTGSAHQEGEYPEGEYPDGDAYRYYSGAMYDPSTAALAAQMSPTSATTFTALNAMSQYISKQELPEAAGSHSWGSATFSAMESGQGQFPPLNSRPPTPQGD